MKFSAKIKDIGRTLDDNLTLILESSKMNPAAAMELSQVDKLDVEIKKHREKRSLDANAYAWVLMSKNAQIIGSFWKIVSLNLVTVNFHVVHISFGNA